MLTVKINLGELEESRERVTSIIFKKDEYTIEGIIRWLIDRSFSYEHFDETEKYFVFKQPKPQNYTVFEYRIIDGQNIGIELGVSEGNEEPEKRSLEDLINLK